MLEIKNNSYLKLLKNSGISSFLSNEPNNYYKLNSSKDVLLNDQTIANIHNIHDLESFIMNANFNNLNALHKTKLLFDGNQKSNIMLIGGASGSEDNKLGKPFMGKEGKLLNNMLSAINLKRENIYITNIIPWQFSNNQLPTNEEILKCLPLIQRHIEIIKPKFILLLGSLASKAILNSNLDIANLRGKWHEYKSNNHNEVVNCLSTYHPNFLLESPQHKRQSWADLKMFKKRIND